MNGMPQAGDRYAQAFTIEPGAVLGHGPRNQRTGHALRRDALLDGPLVLAQRRWHVVAGAELPRHLDGLTRLREFGRRQRT